MRYLIPILLLLTCQAFACKGCRAIPPQGGVVATNGLATSFTLVKPEFGPGESLLGTWTFTNTSAKPVTFQIHRKGWFDTVFTVKKDGVVLKTMRGIDRKDMQFPRDSFTLAPGASEKFQIDLRTIDWDAPRWCDQPGKYEIQLSHGETKTAWVPVTLVAPREIVCKIAEVKLPPLVPPKRPPLPPPEPQPFKPQAPPDLEF